MAYFFFQNLIFLFLYLLVSFSTNCFAITPATTDNTVIIPESNDVSKLRTLVQTLEPGNTVQLPPSVYTMGFSLSNIHGTMDKPIIIEGSDPNSPPLFKGLGEGLKIRNSSYIKIRNISFKGFPNNGINIDDGGNQDSPSHHIVLENIAVSDIGPRGNHDGIKLSGVQHFQIKNCTIEGWGGSGIDIVGSHYGVIENCRFVAREGFRTANSIQIKGGSSFVLVQNNYFQHAGTRIVQIGGATGSQYFRPTGVPYEATDIVVAGNTFIGGEAQIAWTTSQNSHVHHNLFYLPEKWLARILQEARSEHFVPCRTGVFRKNLIITNEKVRIFFNIGKNTDPDSFILQDNGWSASKHDVAKSLPVSDRNSIYDLTEHPMRDTSGLFLMQPSDPRLKDIGPWSYVPWEQTVEFGDIDLVRVDPTAFIKPTDYSFWINTGLGVLAAVILSAGLCIFFLRVAKRKR